MKETYVVRGWYQKLLSGTWDDEYPEWEWDYQDSEYDSLEQAQFVFNSVKCTNDFPHYELLRVIPFRNYDPVVGYYYTSECEEIDEKW